MKKILILFCIALLTACSTASSGSGNQVTVDASPAWDQQPNQLDALVNRVHREWNRHITMSQVKPPAGTTVRIKVRFYSDGGEAALLSIKGGTPKARRACVRALMESHSKWSAAMIAVLGTQQTLTFTFSYS